MAGTTRCTAAWASTCDCSRPRVREFSRRALKSGISIFQSFNDIRNNESFAHDNVIVDTAEARYIFDSISALLRFVNAIEADKFGA